MDNTVIDFNKDGVIDQRDVQMMVARLNTKAKPKDPMDINRDGKITSEDVKLLKRNALIRTARRPVKPTTSTLTPPVLHSTPVQSAAPNCVHNLARRSPGHRLSGVPDHLLTQREHAAPDCTGRVAPSRIAPSICSDVAETGDSGYGLYNRVVRLSECA